MILTRYLNIRSRIKTGDIIAFHRHNLLARTISWWTHSPYSHVALLVRVEIAGIERIFLHNAEPETGVSIILASNYLAQSSGQAWYVPLNAKNAAIVSPNYQTNMLSHIFETLGRAYDVQGVLSFVLPWIKQRKSEGYCSELAAEVLRSVGLLSDTFLSPGQLVAQPIFNTPEAL